MRRSITTAAVVLAVGAGLALAGCGGSSPVVQGSLTDSRITGTGSCGPANGTVQILLANTSGHIMARDNGATWVWAGDACAIRFSFSNVPQLASYGIMVLLGPGEGTIRLTLDAQDARDVKLTIGPGGSVSEEV
jgi:hypothetical protein